ncbi:hypothetical protein [Pseudoalteromonas sp. MTN2-4]|uniref:HD domain-containing protein n=1 Tax=Pseudoalteromonas sp. MTN2-4 TaxID=3056555 RepID=UPI0036F3465B
MAEFRALFVGIKQYKNEKITNFATVIDNDFANLSASLQGIGFQQPEIISTDDPDFVTGNEFKFGVREFFQKTKTPDTLVIYITGHGLHVDNKDYLLLSRAKPSVPEGLLDDCLELDFIDYLRNSTAKNVIVMIDACREAIDYGTKSVKPFLWNKAKVEKVGLQNYLTLYACSPGELANYQTEEQGGYSFFTRAFCSALNAKNYKLRDILDHTNSELDDMVKRLGRSSQSVNFTTDSGDTSFLDIVIGDVAKLASHQNQYSSWQKSVISSELWQFGNITESNDIEAFRTAVDSIVSACWQQYQQAQSVLPDNPWFDSKLPIRVLNRNCLLLQRIKNDFKPTQSELLILLVAPFVREALIAKELQHYASVDIRRLQDEGKTADVYSSRFQQALKANEALTRKCQSLLDRGQDTDFYAVVYWLVYKAVKRNPLLWQLADDTLLKQAFVELDDNIPHIAETLTATRAIEFARIIFSDPERIEMSDRAHAFQDIVQCGGELPEKSVKEKALAYLALLSGRLAIDSNQLPDLLVDHIGLTEVLTPVQIIKATNKVSWQAVNHSLDLKLSCEHQAIDMALLEHIQQANMVLDTLHSKTKNNSRLNEGLKTLPPRLTSDALTAKVIDKEPVYQKPHIHFRLAQQQVQQLLMGTQLYGDANLAIRELYQNALDACRYRQARLQYIKATHANSELLNQWQPQITFTQQVDEQGRAYVECEDTGIGMGMRELSGCFAQAGRRFHDTPEFLEEQASWREHDIELYPNSQFGVGVFSYFMLADEIEITTTRMDKQGKLSHTIEARVSSAGSLFRVVEKPHQGTAGTCIKLILKPNIAEKLSTFETLTELLWIADFPTKVTEADNSEGNQDSDKVNRKQSERIKEFNWQPQQLYIPSSVAAKVVKTANKNFWWYKAVDNDSYTSRSEYSHDQAAILCDGLLTKTHSNFFGTLINLTAKHYPKLTVDRKRTVNDIDYSHWQQVAIKQIPPLIDAKFIDYDYLFRMNGSRYERAFNVIFELTLALFEAKMVIPIALRKEGFYREEFDHIVDINFSHYGLSQNDLELFENITCNDEENNKFRESIIRELEHIEEKLKYIVDSKCVIKARHHRFIQWHELISSKLKQPNSITKQFPEVYESISKHYLSKITCLPIYEWMEVIPRGQLSLKQLLAISEYNGFSIQRNVYLINRDAKHLYQTPNIDCVDDLYGNNLTVLALDNHDKVTLKGLALAAVVNETTIAQVLDHCQTLFQAKLLSFNQAIKNDILHYQFDEQDVYLIRKIFRFYWNNLPHSVEALNHYLSAKLEFHYTKLEEYEQYYLSNTTKKVTDLKIRLQRFLDIGLTLDFELDELDKNLI